MAKLFGLLLLALGLGACSGKGAAEQSLQIRIRNDSAQDITEFWLGAGGMGGGSRSYGAIPSGSLSPYQTMPPVLANYRKLNFLTADGSRYLDVVNPVAHLGVAELPPGAYTFAYRIEGEQAILTLIQDEP